MRYKEIVFKLLDALESAVCGEGGDGCGKLILTSSNISMEQIYDVTKNSGPYYVISWSLQ